MTNQNRQHSARRGQRGVALIFALGIVGLMVFMALTFATVSLTERDVSQNQSAAYQAKILAESAVNRALATLQYESTFQYYGTVKQPLKPMEFYKIRSGGDSLGNTFDWIWKLRTRDQQISTYTQDDMYTYLQQELVTAYDPAKGPTWQYTKDPNGRLTGRFAYIAWKPNGLIDPVSTTAAAGSTTRNGQKVSEDVSFRDLAGSTVPTLSVLWDPLFRHMGLSSVTNENRNLYMNRYFVCPRPAPEPEIFWYSKNGDGSDMKPYYRFNLNRTDWNTITVDQLTDPANLQEYVPSDSEADKRTKADNAKCIPWFIGSDNKQMAANFLAYFAPTPDASALNQTTGPFANVKAPYLNEIVVQLEASLAKTENKDENNNVVDYTYTLSIYADVYVEILNYYTFDNPQVVQISGGNGFFSLKNLKFGKPGGISGLFGAHYVFGSVTPTDTTTFSLPSGSIQTPGYYIFSKKIKVYEGSENSTHSDCNAYLSKDMKFCPENLISVTVGGKTADIVKNLPEKEASVGLATSLWSGSYCSISEGSATTPVYCAKAKDTRFNQDGENQWVCATSTTLSGAGCTLGSPSAPTTAGKYETAGAANGEKPSSGTIFDADYSTSSATDIAGVSTAYESSASVRKFRASYPEGTTMTTPAFSVSELGNIQRGQAFRTLDLLNFNTSQIGWLNGIMYHKGHADSTKGDANLLDMVCWRDANSDPWEYGKLNLNSIYRNGGTDGRGVNTAAAEAFLRNVDNKAAVVTALGDANHTNAPSYDDSAMTTANYTGTAWKRSFGSRAHILTDTNVQTALINSKTKKTEQEESLGKFILETKTGAGPHQVEDTVVIIALAQTLKDHGTSSAATRVKQMNGQKDFGFVTDEGTTMAHGSAITLSGNLYTGSVQRGVWNNGLDEILATQKIIAVLRKDNNGRWKIVRMDYAN